MEVNAMNADVKVYLSICAHRLRRPGIKNAVGSLVVSSSNSFSCPVKTVCVART